MARFTRLFLATVCLLTFAQSAGARSVEMVADTPKAEQASVLYFGKPLDCKIDTCPKKEEETAAPAPVKTDKPLVDAYGMPTGLPALIRGSETSQQVTVSVPTQGKTCRVEHHPPSQPLTPPLPRAADRRQAIPRPSSFNPQSSRSRRPLRSPFLFPPAAPAG